MSGRQTNAQHAFAAMSVRNYRLYWIGQVISRIGTWMQQVSLPWLVLALGGSPLELGIVAALEFVPSMLLAPFGGVVADRVDKRRAIIATQVLASIQVIVLLALIFAGVISIPLIMLMGFVLGLVNAVDMPLRQALAAELVPPPLLTNAIALNSMAFNSARVVGPAVAGVTIAIGTSLFGTAQAGVAFNLAINAVSYSAVVVSLWRMDPAQIRRPPPPDRAISVFASLGEGISYSLRTPIVLWALVLLGVVSTFAMNFRILLPLFTVDVLRVDAGVYGLLYACLGVGSVTGALALAFMHQRRAIMLIIGGAVLLGLLELGLAAVRSELLAAVTLVGIGFFSMLMINTINATIQANVPDALRGRVMALYVTVFAGTTPIGGIFAGGLVEIRDVPTTLVVGAALSLAATGFVAWRLRMARATGGIGRTQIGDAEIVAPVDGQESLRA
ncbi:MAG: MFS transporter [Chloroflexota bacterium]